MPIGPQQGKLVERVIITHPDFINWSFTNLHGGFRWLLNHMQECIELFDEKPFSSEDCAGKVDGSPCTRPVEGMSLFSKSPRPAFWCSECNPLQLGASSNKLTMCCTYDDALFHVRCYDGKRSEQRFLIREMAKAKGLIGNVTDQKLLKFFYEDDFIPA